MDMFHHGLHNKLLNTCRKTLVVCNGSVTNLWTDSFARCVDTQNIKTVKISCDCVNVH